MSRSFNLTLLIAQLVPAEGTVTSVDDALLYSERSFDGTARETDLFNFFFGKVLTVYDGN